MHDLIVIGAPISNCAALKKLPSISSWLRRRSYIYPVIRAPDFAISSDHFAQERRDCEFSVCCSPAAGFRLHETLNDAAQENNTIYQWHTPELIKAPEKNAKETQPCGNLVHVLRRILRHKLRSLFRFFFWTVTLSLRHERLSSLI